MNIGIVGYGNLGKGVELSCSHNPDIRLSAIFTRRPKEEISLFSNTPVIPVEEILSWKDRIDLMILCGGSATDLPVQGPDIAAHFNTVDSFDTHAKIPGYFTMMDHAARANGHLSLISCGWDPGLFSLARVLFSCVIPNGRDYTFWGKGVSQGHSDAIRRVDGVLDARQYTIPSESALVAARNEDTPDLPTRNRHTRDCYVVAKEGADLDLIKKTIVEMPDYFADYDTSVTFISKEELLTHHSSLPHGGFVIRNGKTDESNRQIAEFTLKLDSNPQFTASVLTAYARAVYRMYQEGKTGAISVLDVPFSLLSIQSPEELRREML